MLQSIYAMRDNKAGFFLQPLYVVGDAQDFIDDVNSLSEKQFKDVFIGTPIADHPEGFALYGLGFFDTCTGKHELYDAPKHLVNLVDLDTFKGDLETPKFDDVIEQQDKIEVNSDVNAQ